MFVLFWVCVCDVGVVFCCCVWWDFCCFSVNEILLCVFCFLCVNLGCGVMVGGVVVVLGEIWYGDRVFSGNFGFV